MPAQTFRLMLDNTFMGAAVLADNFHVNTTVCQASNVRRSTFHYNVSKTFHGWTAPDGWKESSVSPAPYLPYEDPKCSARFGYDSEHFEDTIAIGNVSLPSIPAEAIVNFTGPLNADWAADGYFGLAAPEYNFEKARNTILKFLAPFPRMQMTIYYARTEPGDGHSGSDGQITLGGSDIDNCDSQRVGGDKLTLCAGPGYAWCLGIQSVSLGEQAIGPSYGSMTVAAPVVTRTSFITAPKEAVDAVVKATGAEYDFRTDTFRMDCDSRSSLPDLVFKNEAMEYRVPAVDYARKLNAGDKKCTLMISVSKLMIDSWYLGTSFFRSYCQLLDYGTNTFSLSKVLH